MMTDLTNVSTEDLVRELAGRDGVEKLEAPAGMEYRISCRKTCHCDECAQADVKCPATILVVRRERE